MDQIKDFKVHKKNGNYVVKKKISVAKLSEKSTSTGKPNKKCSYKAQQANVITYLICALLNSGGGKLKLKLEGVPPSPEKQILEFIRTVEQKVLRFVDFVTFSSNLLTWTRSRTCDKIVVDVKNTGRLFTRSYNFFLPTQSQVEAVPSCQWHSEEFIKKMLYEKKIPAAVSTATKIGSHHTRFTQGEVTDLFESETVQFKNLKSDSSKNISLADRITGKNNKFAKYVSAFANHSGGHIYYGIEDDGKIVGEKLNENDKSEVRKKIRKAINNMIWAGGGPQEDRHWKVYFEPVEQAESETFIVVVFVAQCPGGAFADKPECCHIVDSPEPKVEDMDYATWRERLLYPYPRSQNQATTVPDTIRRSSWSSEKLQRICVSLHGLFQSLMNNGSWKELDRQVNRALQESGGDEKLFIFSKKINASIRKGDFTKARRDFDEYNELMPLSSNASIFEVIKLYLKLVEARCQGKYKVCYEIAQEGMTKEATIPVGFLTASFYAITGTVAAILAGEEEDKRKAKELLADAEGYFATTLQHLNECCESAASSSSVIDIKKKVYINLALLKLGITLSGNILRKRITDKEMDAAHSFLNEVIDLEHKSCQKSRFREIQGHFMEAALQYRLSQNEIGENQRERLEKAHWHSTQALKHSRECKFEEMAQYTRTLKGFLTEKLVCKSAEALKIYKDKSGNNWVQDHTEDT